MWDLPGPGLEPVSPELAGGFLTTAPPEKSPDSLKSLIISTSVFSQGWHLLIAFLLWVEIFLALCSPSHFRLYPGHSVYHVMWLWVLFTKENVDLYIYWPRLGSGHMFQPTFCGLQLQYQLSFQSLLQCCSNVSYMCNIGGQSGIWVVLCPIDQFSKPLVFCLGSDPYIHSLEVIPEVHTQSYGITLLCSLLFTITPTLFGSLRPPFPVPQPEIWGFSFSVLLCTSYDCLCVWG